MEIAITEASETNMKNSHIGDKLIEKTDKSLYNIPTVADYISSNVNGEKIRI